MVQRIRTSLALLKSIIDKSAELHGENADPVIMIVDTDEVIHYEIYPIDNWTHKDSVDEFNDRASEMQND